MDKNKIIISGLIGVIIAAILYNFNLRVRQAYINGRSDQLMDTTKILENLMERQKENSKENGTDG